MLWSLWLSPVGCHPHQVSPMTQESHASLLPCCTGIKQRRYTAHTPSSAAGAAWEDFDLMRNRHGGPGRLQRIRSAASSPPFHQAHATTCAAFVSLPLLDHGKVEHGLQALTACTPIPQYC